MIFQLFVKKKFLEFRSIEMKIENRMLVSFSFDFSAAITNFLCWVLNIYRISTWQEKRVK